MSQKVMKNSNIWAKKFGDDYIGRNNSASLLGSKKNALMSMFQKVSGVNDVREYGANIGLNLIAMKELFPDIDLYGLDINENAVKQANALGVAKVDCVDITECLSLEPVDLVLCMGCLIHIQPSRLQTVYENLFKGSNKYILIGEYYNPTPVEIEYRGVSGALYKRDFAGELIDSFDLKLVDYGFVYHRDEIKKLDDITWFLLSK
jgi:pseudaminic acid biosynthesis-associated methylase